MRDLVVIGGGPIGLAVAIVGSARGLSVSVVDKRRPPIDKACGEGLMPDGVAILERFGVELSTGRRFFGIRYLDDDQVAEGRFAGGSGLGIRRTELHSAMVRRAQAVGVDLRWGEAAEGLADGAVRTSCGTLAARWTVAADGLNSPTRRWLGLAVERRAEQRFGVRRHFAVSPWSDCVEVYWAASAEAYVTPVGPREVGVAMLWSGGASRFDRLLEKFPRLASRLAGASPATRDRGAGPLWQRPRAVVQGSVALVGDAAGYLDAITGEGLALGLHQAELVTEAIGAGDLGLYEKRFRRLVGWPFRLIRALLLAERHPRLRRRLVAALARDPELFSALLSVHAREVEPPRVGFGLALRLARGLAIARERAWNP